LLGAAALGDIGKHFPDSDPAYTDAASTKFLAHVRALLDERGYRVANVDITVIAEAPRLAPHIAAMRANIADALAVRPSAVSVKATTTEGLGLVGRREGLAAHAVAVIERSD
jgi:2-C-methyl-D-erythritol 2,4-cyclodiphosphate synthase